VVACHHHHNKYGVLTRSTGPWPYCNTAVPSYSGSLTHSSYSVQHYARRDPTIDDVSNCPGTPGAYSVLPVGCAPLPYLTLALTGRFKSRLTLSSSFAPCRCITRRYSVLSWVRCERESAAFYSADYGSFVRPSHPLALADARDGFAIASDLKDWPSWMPSWPQPLPDTFPLCQQCRRDLGLLLSLHFTHNISKHCIKCSPPPSWKLDC